MNYNEVVSRIQTIISSVSGTGKVHIQQRYARDPEEFASVFYEDDRLRSWIISRDSITVQWTAGEGNTLIHKFKIYGYLSTKDSAESEIEFQQIVDDVVGAFRPHTHLDGYCEIHHPLQVNVVGYRAFAGQLCHYAECSLDIQEYLTE